MGSWLVFLTVILCCLFNGASGRAAEVVSLNNGTTGCVKCHLPCASAQKITQAGCTGCHRGNAATSRRDLAHNFLIGKDYASYRLPDSPGVIAGRELVEKLACRRCHVQHRRGNKLATDLDQLLAVASVAEIDTALRNPAFYMPQFSFGAAARAMLITRIFAGGVDYQYDEQQTPLVVHFEDGAGSQNLFSKHCGSCHRVLTEQYGGLGSGIQAPNLSGLLSEFYPRNLPENQRWTVDAVLKWVKNPRTVRPLTTMPPQVIEKEQLRRLIDDTWPQ